MATLTDNRQLIARDNLPEITAKTNTKTDAVIRAIDASLQPMFRMSASATPNLILNIASNFVQNPESLRFKTSAPLGINGALNTFTSGTVTFPAATGGTITPSVGSTSTLTLASGNYMKVLISIDTSGFIVVTQGSAAGTLAGSTLPAEPANTYSVGYVGLYNNAGTIQNITNGTIYHFNFNKYLPTGNLVGTNDSQTLTNKTLNNVVISGVSSDLVPTGASFDLGDATTYPWDNAYINNVYATNLEAPVATGILNIGVAPQTDFLNIGTGSDVRTINIGTGSGQTFINLGGPTDFVAIAGTLTWTNTTNANVTSKTITMNNGSAVSSAQNSGLVVREGLTARTATAATWQASTQTVRLAMANTGAIVAGHIVTTSAFSDAVHNGSFEVTAVSANAWIEVQNSAVTSSANDVTSQTASIIEPYDAAYIKLANARNAWEFSTADNTAKNFRLFSGSGANSWEFGATTAAEVFLRPNADSTGGSFIPYDNGTELGKAANRWNAFFTNINFSGGATVKTRAAVSADYTAAADDFIIPVQTSAGPITITLPNSAAGKIYIVKDVGGQADVNNITMDLQNSVFGTNISVLDSQYGSWTFVSILAGVWTAI